LSASLPEQVVGFLRDSNLIEAGEVPAASALPGGVSSEIWRVDTARGPLCVKRALHRLRVAQVWEAPVERNHFEYEWFRVAGRAAPGAVPRVLAEGGGTFAMQYLEPARHPVWKTLLSQGTADVQFAAKVGAALAAIHGATAGREEVAGVFATDRIFHDIRLEPYLVFTGKRFPFLNESFDLLAKRTAQTRLCLVHGDVSPKNILCGPDGPIFLDAECAWYGDPAFDVAFCLNHLLLKCLWVPAAAQDFLGCLASLWDSYKGAISWEEKKDLEYRIATLLPALLLARVDGKSPVEYITEEPQKQRVRDVAAPLIRERPETLQQVLEAWRKSLA
jgi:aminoglycoside phosphotransferase (APT) family kinase protein